VPEPAASTPATGPAGPGRATRPAVNRRKHPSHGARAIALVSSVAATVGVAAALAGADRSHATTTTVAGSAMQATTTAPPSSTSSPGNSTSATAAAPSTTTASTTYADGVYTGTAEFTRWGDVQVQVTIANGQIVEVATVQSPGDRKSVAINNRAQPVLEAEAIAAQSADIDAVSGATYTSRTYQASLQSALDQAAQAAQSAG
jgi:uncharacterized protein with FMN-binding domain